MHWLLLILIALHGLIHLLGFCKAMEWLQLEELQLNISGAWGLLWLLAGLLFLLAVAAAVLEWKFQYHLLLAGVALSTLLVIVFWQDAKFALILNVIFLLVGGIGIQLQRLDARATAEMQTLLSDKAGEAAMDFRDQLPEIVQKWLENSGIYQRPLFDRVKIVQSLHLQLEPGGDSYQSAEAEQVFRLEDPAFIWYLKMNYFGILPIRGWDQFRSGRGEMRISALGMWDIVHASGPKIDEGSAQRFLGEMVWFPLFAMNEDIRWEVLEDQRVRAHWTVGELEVSGEFTFDEQGNFLEFRTMRYRGGEGDAGRTPWIIKADAHREFSGIRIPTRLSAYWELDSGRWEWLKMEIEAVEYYDSEQNFK